MFRKILFPTDFSDGSMRAMLKFGEQNRIDVGECILLHVIDESLLEEMMQGYSLLYGSEEGEIENLEEKLIHRASEKMEEIVKRCSEMVNAERIKTIVKVGVPHEIIIAVARDEDISLIIMPSHGKMGFSSELLGSTTMRVLKKRNAQY